MALKHLDNFQFWTDTLPGQPGTFASTSGTTIVANRLHQAISGISGGALISNNITDQGTYVLNGRLNIVSTGAFQPINEAIWQLDDNGNNQCGLCVQPDNKLRFYRQSAFVPIALASILAMVFDNAITFYDFEAKFVIGNAGSVELRIGGGVQIGPTVVDNQQTGNSTANSVRLAAQSSGSQGITMNWEHMIVMDGSGANLNGNFIGPVDVVLLPPTGDGFYTAWSLTGAATRWQAVQTADGDTSYISASAVGTKNTFEHGNLPLTATAVIATGIWCNAREDDAVTRGFKVLLRDSTPTDALGSTEFFVGPDYLYFFQPFEISPFTGIAWTVSEVNTVEYGVQVTT